MKKLLLLVVLLALGSAGYFVWKERAGLKPSELRFRTARVERGEVLEGVQASGAVQPFLLVQVGTQVSGVIEKLMKDFNDDVKAGETIALIDSQRYAAQCAQDEASLGRARADVERVRAQLVQAEKDLVRQRKLSERRLVSEADLDAAIATADALRAQLDVTAAVVSQSRAQLDGDLVNLRYATIVSPINGTVVSRNVDVGQTVAASLAAPTLFVIANDLTKIQVQASVPEADVGKIAKGQRASFGVDAHSYKTFEGVVSQVRLASSTVQNVVTYTVLIDAANPEKLLLPGMTANVTFEIERSAKDALRVPLTALRYQPPDDLVEAGVEKPKEHAKKASARSEKPAFGRVYVRSATGLLHPVPVRLGVSDGVSVAVTPREKGALDEGSEVVLGVAAEQEEATTNPFAPSFGRAKSR